MIATRPVTMCGGLNVDLEIEIIRKMAFNATYLHGKRA